MAETLEQLLARGFEIVASDEAPMASPPRARSSPQLADVLRGDPETHVVLAGLDEAGWTVERLDEHPDVLAVFGPVGLEVLGEHLWQPWHDAVAVVVEDGASPVIRSADTVLVLQREVGRLAARALERPVPFPSAAEAVEAGGAVDWLREELIAALGLGPFGHALAIGHHLRLAEHPPIPLEDMLAGRAVDEPGVTRWLAALRPSHKRRLRADLRAEIVRVGDLLSEADELDPLYLELQVKELLRGRDDLESLREVFWRMGMCEVDSELADLDRRMRSFLGSLPVTFAVGDPRLTRVHEI
ncbi:MAG TPA: hypothetical protein QGF58_23845, partial [Myxococcota bacterium]|nr:hypothetical protein [Myxococcota bacterium]